MDENDKKLIRNRYNERLREFGPGIKALASGTEERRSIRFDVLTEIGIRDGCSVLDVGCGLADFYTHLLKKGVDVRYTGIDIVPELIEAGQGKYPGLDLQVRDLQEMPFPEASFDYVVCSQVFNLRLPDNRNEVLVRDMMRRMFITASAGVAVDFLTSYVDFKQEQLHYYQPETQFSCAKQITRRVMLRHDYPLFEFCLYLYPNFEGWSRSQL